MLRGTPAKHRRIRYSYIRNIEQGVLQNGDVAVKKIISSMTIDEKLFRREVDSLMEVNDHQNVVKFLGFCSHTVHTTVKNPESRGYIYAEKRERLICFEYISNGSLDKHITGTRIVFDVIHATFTYMCFSLS
jgi:coatomer subunit beta'